MATTFPTLPSLPALQAADSAAQSVLSTANDAAKSVMNAASGGFYGWLTGGQGVMIVLGLLLIAAGIFSFDKTRELIVSGAHTAASVA